MAEFFAELKRRQMFRVAAAYAVIAWLLLQLINNLTPALRLPEWAATLVVLLLVAGFPIALLFCWIQHLPSADGSASSAKMGKLDWVLIGSLAVVLCFMGYQQLAPSSDAPARQAGVDAAREASVSQRGVSLAVLPFANLSGDPSQEFFSDGITEEITSALARVPDLRVVARTSAYQFRDQNRDIQSIGQQLRATHFIEGSVRKAGDRVRITAQLIRAEDATHVWAETFDRELTDVFAIQEDIATAIAGALRMPLGLRPGENLVSNRNIDPDSYAQYLRARALLLARAAAGAEGYREAVALLEQVVAKNPNYAPAWALLARSYGRDDAKALAAAQRAVSLDPNNAVGNLVLAAQQGDKSFLGYYERVQRALSLDPNNPDILHGHALRMAAAGYVKEALAIRQKLLETEPTFGVNFSHTAVALWLNGRTDAAIEMLNSVPPAFVLKNMDLAIFDASIGRYNDAADALEKLSGPDFPPDIVEKAVNLLRMAPAKPDSPQSLPSLGNLSWVFLHVGAPERVLDDLTPREGGTRYVRRTIVWHPSFAAVRKTEAFKAFMRESQFLDFWRAKGWPPQCHPTTGDDFECE